MDNLDSDSKRRVLMSRVRRSGTEPEVKLRHALHRHGYRYRLNSGKGIPGTPDIVLRRYKVAIFVDGCFWHGCGLHGTFPKRNAGFWADKIRRNQDRDLKVDRALRSAGWIVFRVWEHQIKGALKDVVQCLNKLTGRP